MAGSNHIQSVLKAAEMLKIVGEAENGIKLLQVAEAMGQKLPAIHHLSKTLISCGFLRKKEDNSLVLGENLIRLAGNGKERVLYEAAAGELTRLYNLFPFATIVLAEVKIPEVELAVRISRERPNVIQRERGQIFNIYVNAVALISLALADESTRELMMNRQSFSEYGIHLWKSKKKLLLFLDEAKKEKYVVSPFDLETFFRPAVPLLNKNGEMKAALGMNIPASQIKGDEEKETVKRGLQEAAARISERI